MIDLEAGQFSLWKVAGEVGGDTLYNGLCEVAPPERGPYFGLQVWERVGKSGISVCKRPNKAN